MPRLLTTLITATLLLPLGAGAAEVRLVGWGDSLTYGYYDFPNTNPPNHCYDGHPDNNPPETCGQVARLNTRLNAESPSWDLGVLNLGKGGEKTPASLTRMGDPAAACPNPLPAINKMKYWQCTGWIEPHDVFVLLEGSNDVTQQYGAETIAQNLEAIGLKAESYGFEVVVLTLPHRHPYACIDSGNSKTRNVNTRIRNIAASHGWPVADLYNRLDVLPNLFSNYYQNWDWMKCDPNLPDPPPAAVDPLGHLSDAGYDKVTFEASGSQYEWTIEYASKQVLPPRLVLTPPVSLQTGTPATFSVALPDLATTDKLLWDFGDGRFGFSITPSASPSTWDYVYVVPGTYTVTVTAKHANGSQRVRTAMVTVGGSDLTIFSGGFETGDTSAWSEVVP